MDYIEQYVRAVDPEVAEAIAQEENRQNTKLELIASENFVSRAVMAAQGCVMTNKYAEGYPGRRYYGGCEFVDVVEDLARERLKKLFGCEHANVQPHSGAQANTAVYFAALKPGDTVMGMNLSHGGHLTHGSPVNLSGKYFRFVEYGVSPQTETIDYDQVRDIAKACQPKMIVAGASAYPRFLDFAKFREIADEVGALLFVDMALYSRSGCRRSTPFSHSLRSFRHHYNAQNPARPRGVYCAEKSGPEDEQRGISRNSGRTFDACHCRQSGLFKEALSDDFKQYQEQIVQNAAVLAAALSAGFAPGLRRH